MINPAVPFSLQERLSYIPEAPHDHREKIDRYNELLEDVYQREVELTRFKSALLDMHQEIAEEVQHLSSTGVLSPITTTTITAIDAARSESESENVLSDSSGSSGDYKSRRNSSGRPSVKGGKKIKRKFGRIGNRNSKVPEAQLDAEWDYRLDLGKKGRRGSDVSATNIPI